MARGALIHSGSDFDFTRVQSADLAYNLTFPLLFLSSNTDIIFHETLFLPVCELVVPRSHFKLQARTLIYDLSLILSSPTLTSIDILASPAFLSPHLHHLTTSLTSIQQSLLILVLTSTAFYDARKH